MVKITQKQKRNFKMRSHYANFNWIRRMQLPQLVFSPVVVSGTAFLAFLCSQLHYFSVEAIPLMCAGMFFCPVAIGPHGFFITLASTITNALGPTAALTQSVGLGNLIPSAIASVPKMVTAQKYEMNDFLKDMEVRERASEYGKSVNWDAHIISNERDNTFYNVCDKLDSLESRVDSVCRPDLTNTVTNVVTEYATNGGNYGQAVTDGLARDIVNHVWQEGCGLYNDATALNNAVEHAEVVNRAYQMINK